MLRKFGIALFVITAVLISRASATTFFTTQASFNAAAFPHTVGPLAGNVMETDVFTTGSTRGLPFADCCINVFTTTNPPVSVPFNTYSLDLAAFGQAIDTNRFGKPNCTATALTENILVLPTSILGFSSSPASTGTFGDPPAMINSDIVPINVT